MSKMPETNFAIPLAHMPVMQAEEIDSLCHTLKACGDALRIKILQVMKYETFGVLELARLFDTKQSGMSHHLKILSQANLVEAQREGNAIFYRRPLHFSHVSEQIVAKNLFSLIDCYPLDDITRQGIELISQQRAEQSQAFFAKNAHRMKEQQELIASHDLYAATSIALLNELNHTGQNEPRTVLEIGPGEGHLLHELSKQFTSVIALDNSESMLEKAKETSNKAKLENIEFICGDTQDYLAAVNSHVKPNVHAVVMNMVLHHVPTPAKIFSDVYHFLEKGGVLVICDLSKHDQEWAKDNCGDLWCGFEADELNAWANQAGFKEDKDAYIGLRNGFQIQLRRYIKL